MSLKSFHLFFIVASVLVTFVFVAWSVSAYSEAHKAGDLGMGIGALVIGIALIVYGRAFRKKYGRLNS